MGYVGRKTMLVGETNVKGEKKLTHENRSLSEVGNPYSSFWHHRAGLCMLFIVQSYTIFLSSLSPQFKTVPVPFLFSPRALISLYIYTCLLFLLLMSEVSTRI